MLTSNHVLFSAYCHECRTPIEVIPATEDVHRGLVLNHSREYKHTCSLYKIIGVFRNYKFVPTDKIEVARFSNGDELKKD